MLVRLATALALAVTAAALAAAPAAATHEPGAIYKGTTSIGSKVEFTVSDDGSQVIHYLVEGSEVAGTYPGGTPCTLDSGNEIPAGVPIVNERFEYSGSGDADLFEGSFDASASASGTYRIVDSATTSIPCSSPLYTWTATVSSNSGDFCDKAKARLKKAKKQLKQADSPAAKEKAKKKVKQAKKDVALFC